MRTLFDLTTLNAEKMAKLPAYDPLARHHLSDHYGSGCFGDPPGYPSYFIQHVYTSQGNDPSRGPVAVIKGVDGVHRVIETAEEWQKDRGAQLHDLWRPLPLDHVRTQAWIIDTLKHMAHCYHDELATVEPYQYGKPTFFVYPLPNYKLRFFHDDARFSDVWRVEAQALVKRANKELEANAKRLATFDNATGVRLIRKFYPDFGPGTIVSSCNFHEVAGASVVDFVKRTAAEWVIDAPTVHQGDWWHCHALRPTMVDTCNAMVASSHLKQHREGWCQFCGLTQPEEKAEVRP